MGMQRRRAFELAQQGRVLRNSFGVMHPSQTNYIASIAGELCNVTSDEAPPPLTQRTIVDLIEDSRPMASRGRPTCRATSRNQAQPLLVLREHPAELRALVAHPGRERVLPGRHAERARAAGSRTRRSGRHVAGVVLYRPALPGPQVSPSAADARRGHLRRGGLRGGPGGRQRQRLRRTESDLHRAAEENFGLGSLGKNDASSNWFQFLSHAKVLALAEFAGALYMVYAASNGELCFRTADTQGWSAEYRLGVMSSGRLALAAMVDRLVLVYETPERTLQSLTYGLNTGWSTLSTQLLATAPRWLGRFVRRSTLGRSGAPHPTACSWIRGLVRHCALGRAETFFHSSPCWLGRLVRRTACSASTDTFFEGQERSESANPQLLRRLRGVTEEYRRLNVLNYEMEAGTLLKMGAVYGFATGCVCGVVAQRTAGERIVLEQKARAVERAIEIAVIAAERFSRWAIAPLDITGSVDVYRTT